VKDIKGTIMKKYYTVTEIEAQIKYEPIWAINGSSQSEVGQAGDVHVGIPKVNGGTKVDSLYIPQTFLPHCITEQIPRGQLLASSEFRNAVNSKLLILITSEYADQLLKGPGVAEERERLMQLKRAVREATAARSITQSGAEILNTSDTESDSTDNPKDKPELSASFSMFANTLTSKSDIEVMNALRSRGRISRLEVRHLVKLLSDKPKTVDFLKAKLEKN
jgi:hypothetical protein